MPSATKRRDDNDGEHLISCKCLIRSYHDSVPLFCGDRGLLVRLAWHIVVVEVITGHVDERLVPLPWKSHNQNSLLFFAGHGDTEEASGWD